MRRIVVALASTVTALVLLFSYHTSLSREGTAPVVASGTSSSTGAAQSQDLGSGTTASGTTTDVPGTITGQSVQTRYGPVQVQITVVDGTVTDATAIDYPSSNGRDQTINSRAVPVLEDETLQAQSAQVDVVSGATYTSEGYAQSLQSAIDEANL